MGRWDRITVRDYGYDLGLQVPHDWTAGFVGQLPAPVFQARAPLDAAVLRVLNSTTSSSLAAIARGFAASELKKLRKQDLRASVATKGVYVSAGPAVRVTMRYRGDWFDRRSEITQVVYFLKHGKRAYEFDYSAADITRSDEALFTRLINSVRLLGGAPVA